VSRSRIPRLRWPSLPDRPDRPRPDRPRPPGSRDEGGAVAVEFALVFPLLFFLLFGALVFGWRLWEHQAGASTAGQAARLAAVGVPDVTGFEQGVLCLGERNGLHAGGQQQLKVTFLDRQFHPTTLPQLDGYVQVSLTYRSALGAFPLVTSDTGTFTTTAVSPLQQLPSPSVAGTLAQTFTLGGVRCGA